MALVDTSLPSKPTGAAADFAAAHEAEHELKLYGGWFCPFVQRAWIVLHEKKIAHQYVEINPYAKAPEFLALNPRGLVPTLAVPGTSTTTTGINDKNGAGGGGKKEGGGGGGGGGEKPLYESTIICEYLDELYSDETTHGAPLLPRGDTPAAVYARARCRLWIDHVGGKIVPAFYRVLQHTPATTEYSLEEARGVLLGHIKTFAAEMADAKDGPWFLGGTFSLVDVVLAPWAKRLFLIDHYKPGGVGIPKVEGEAGGEEDEEEDKVWRRWRIWFEEVVKRTSVRYTWSDDEMYVLAYKRYAEDTTQSEVAKATRKGTRLP